MILFFFIFLFIGVPLLAEFVFGGGAITIIVVMALLIFGFVGIMGEIFGN